MLGADMERVLIDLLCQLRSSQGSVDEIRTFFSLARKKLRTRNLKRSSSVWMTISLKFVFGSMFPVWSSTSSICLRH